MNEQFSAFLDGEAARDEADTVVNALMRDESLRASWSRQHWLRTALRAHRGEMTAPLDADFSARVMQAIGNDSEAHRAAEVVPMAGAAADRDARRGSRRRWRGMAGGLAVAASAAGIALFVNGGNVVTDQTTTPAAPGDGQVATTAADSAATNTGGRGMAEAGGSTIRMASAGAGSTPDAAPAASGSPDHWSVSDPALADELNGYLVEHNGLARGYGLSGTTPAFVRVASYGQESTQ